MGRKISRYGWIPDLPDHRDFLYAAPLAIADALPVSINLHSQCIEHTVASVIGGHAVMSVGYDEAKQWFIVRNSWGSKWGINGYFTLPYLYLISTNLASDFWTIRVVQ